MSACLRVAVPKVIKRASPLGDVSVLIVEQVPGKRFNLGKLLNVGFDFLTTNTMLDGATPEIQDLFCYQPVDCIPKDFSQLRCRAGIEFHGFTWDEPEFYKACWFTFACYRRINGFSNDFWGWGDEDNELFVRLEICGERRVLSPADFEVLNYRSSPDYLTGAAPHHDGHLTRRLRKSWNIYASGLNTLSYSVQAIGTRFGAQWIRVEI